MKLLEFTSTYPDEAACVAKLRQLRESQEHVCPKCGCKEWYWKNDKLCYECKHCHNRSDDWFYANNKKKHIFFIVGCNFIIAQSSFN